jgi:hypothetical protein
MAALNKRESLEDKDNFSPSEECLVSIEKVEDLSAVNLP